MTESPIGARSYLRRRAVIAFPLSLVIVAAIRRAASQTATGITVLPRLSYAGTELPPVMVDPAYFNFRLTVDLAGDSPLASYMAARPRGLHALQRTPGGPWIPWDQRTQSLVDNRFARSGGNLVFAFTAANFSALSFPVALELAYRTPAGVKFGVLTMTAKR